MEIEDKLILAKVIDKVGFSKTRNKITHTEFLTPYQRGIIEKELQKRKIKNYFFFGGYEEAEGKALICYPEKLELEIVKDQMVNIIKAIKVELPKEMIGKYTHRDYLGSSMQTGLNRNRIGDIIVHEDKAYILVLEENAEYIASSLKDCKQFKKAKIEIQNFKEIELKEQEFDEMVIRVSSMRLDCVISEIAKVSRAKAETLITEEKVFVNAKCETKGSKNVKENDVLAIRGKGKFIIFEIIGSKKNGKIVLKVGKFK